LNLAWARNGAVNNDYAANDCNDSVFDTVKDRALLSIAGHGI